MKSFEPKITYSKETVNLGEVSRSKHKYRAEEWKKQTEKWRPTTYRDGIIDRSVRKLAQYYARSHAEETADINKVKKQRECTFNFIEHNKKKYSHDDHISCFRSKSEFVPKTSCDDYPRDKRVLMHPSSPAVNNAHERSNSKKETNDGKPVREKTGKRQCTKTGSIEKLIEKYDKIVFDNVGSPPVCPNRTRAPMWKDPRLKEKYSLLKVPWQNSQRVAAYKVQPVYQREETQPREDSPSSKTYYYDEGSDIDSLCLPRGSAGTNETYGNALQGQAFTILNIITWTCFACIMGLVVWFVSENQILRNILFPKPPESTLMRYVKLVGGAVVYSANSVLKFIGRLLTIPTQTVFQSAHEEIWPPTG
ncbi:uncharacterized protein LOC126743391 [Anthonomus grandis grandis]|uniref:uncharacterized protein LOC126743391 n=1 Tax=Anthonomus grandis grandis TaxID=2921223 RepID=UPI0021663695|nr:uncharacterized protein LOC126743391 [Anthonomus grandis grandis]